MSKRITIELNTESIRQAKREIEDYKRNLEYKCRLFCDKLYELGISVARVSRGTYAPYITFSKQVNDVENGIEEILVMSNTGLITVQWLTKNDEVHEAIINPIMMAEFGSGWLADDDRAKDFGGGQGTLNTYGHAFDSEWHFKTLDGQWHTSSGQAPNYPLYNAYKNMVINIANVSKEVFG